MADVATPVLLIDFENIQELDSLKKMKNTDFSVRIFLGSNQSKLPVSLVRQVQPFGTRLQWIKIEGNGKNALDFHIAYSIGLLVAEDRKRRIYVLSKDTGFDPLIAYLSKNNIPCERIEELSSFLSSKMAPPEKSILPDNSCGINGLCASSLGNRRVPSLTDIILFINNIPLLARPKKPKALAAHLACHFKKQNPDFNFSLIVDELAKIGKITIKGDTLSYHDK